LGGAAGIFVRFGGVYQGGGGADFAVPILIVKGAPSSRRFAIAALV
jgi:hypothetical protein